MTTTTQPSALRVGPVLRAYAVLLILIGVVFVVGGVMLVVDQGSVYYVVAGLACVLGGALVWRADRRGAWVYGALLVVTTTWALYEVGPNLWGLVARLAFLFVVGLPFLLPRARRLARPSTEGRGARGWLALSGGLIVAILAGLGLHTLAPAIGPDPLYRTGGTIAAPAPLPQSMSTKVSTDWIAYGNDQGGTRFSPLDQINAANVTQLQVAWTADVGPVVGKATGMQVTPINVGDALYLCNGYNVVLSLDAETGVERWRHDMSHGTPPSGKPCRGVAYFHVPDATGVCADRIVSISQGSELIALDAATGTPCPDFGTDGRVSLREGLGGRPELHYYVSSAPQIIRGKIVFGGAVVDGQFWGEPSGVIRAYDAVTGRLAWAFDGGRPDQHGAPPPGETYTASSPNSWAPISADETLGLVYLPMGNSVPDFFGGYRRPFDEELGSSVVALDAETGTMRWRFQTVHHDIWDYDLPAQPTLVDLLTANGVRHALIQSTKRGEIFVLDRETGKPIKPVVEQPVPQGPIAPGERLSPTQPFSVGMPALSGPRLREVDMWGMTPIDQMMCRILFKRSRYDGPMTPVNLEKPAIFDPGFAGGGEWGGVSIDADRGILAVNWVRIPSRVPLVTRADATEKAGWKPFTGDGQGTLKQLMGNTPYADNAATFLSPAGVPCIVPPWGYMTAIDLASGRVIWSKPFGTGRESGPFGIRSQLPMTLGVPNIGGPVTTRGGLTFIGATVDSEFRAFETTTGKELWRAALPAGGQATPMTYRSPKSGRQFVVIAAGGKPALKTQLGTKVVAYALPK